jgi:hypothetical protein
LIEQIKHNAYAQAHIFNQHGHEYQHIYSKHSIPPHC